MVEFVERGPHVREIGSLVPVGIKPMTYTIYTCRFLAWCMAFIGHGNDWLVQCQDNVTEWAIEPWWMDIKRKQTRSSVYFRIDRTVKI